MVLRLPEAERGLMRLQLLAHQFLGKKKTVRGLCMADITPIPLGLHPAAQCVATV